MENKDWVEFVFSLHNLAQNLIQQFPEEVDFLCRFTLNFHCCYSKIASHGWVVYKKGQCFVTNVLPSKYTF